MLLPPKPGKFTAHTNHPLENDDVDYSSSSSSSSSSSVEKERTALQMSSPAVGIRPHGPNTNGRVPRYGACSAYPQAISRHCWKRREMRWCEQSHSPQQSKVCTFGLAVLICDAEQPRLECTIEFEPFTSHSFSPSDDGFGTANSAGWLQNLIRAIFSIP